MYIYIYIYIYICIPHADAGDPDEEAVVHLVDAAILFVLHHLAYLSFIHNSPSLCKKEIYIYIYIYTYIHTLFIIVYFCLFVNYALVVHLVDAAVLIYVSMYVMIVRILYFSYFAGCLLFYCYLCYVDVMIIFY